MTRIWVNVAWIIGFIGLTGPAWPDISGLNAIHQDDSKALKRYYESLKNLKSPTPQDSERLKGEVLAPAQRDSEKKFFDQMAEKKKAALEQAKKEFQKDTKAHMDELDVDPAKLTQVDKSKVTVDGKPPEPEPDTGVSQVSAPSPSKKSESYTSPSSDKPIDGSNVPREIEFPGPQKRQ